MKREVTKIIREQAKNLDISNFLDCREYLKTLYNLTKACIPGFSYLKYSEALGFSHTNVVRLIIAGKRTFTAKSGEKVASTLDLRGQEKKFWKLLVDYNNAKLPAERDELFAQLMKMKSQLKPALQNNMTNEYYSEWYNPIIREILALENCKAVPLDLPLV